MRRLFSNFAGGRPGIGLLLIRIVAGISLIIDGIEKLRTGQTILGSLAIADGLLFVAGLWTPVAGSLVVPLSAWGIFIRHESPFPLILLSAMGLALALLGPGAFSVDARLFGLKRIDLKA
jgi:putative oxidoreductase